MPANIHLIKAEGAYERVPPKGQNGLRFPVERYLPPKDFINFDDELKYRTKLLHMARNSNRTTLCLRCGVPTGQHPKDICFCQWCGCRADDIHPDLECPWIYASVSFWKSKLIITDPASGQRSSDWVPVNVQIQPTKEEQAFLALENPIFLDFPRAREGRDIVVPDGTNMMQPALMPRKLKAQELNRGEKRQHEDSDEASERPIRRPFVVDSDKHVELKDALLRELKYELFHELSRMREKIARLSDEVTNLRALTETNRENQFHSRPPIRQYGGYSPSRSEYREDTSSYSSNPRRQGDRSSQFGNQYDKHRDRFNANSGLYRSTQQQSAPHPSRGDSGPFPVDSSYQDNSSMNRRSVYNRQQHCSSQSGRPMSDEMLPVPHEQERVPWTTTGAGTRLFNEKRLQSTSKEVVYAAREQQSSPATCIKREYPAEPHWQDQPSRSFEYGRMENRGTLVQQRNDRIDRDQASRRSPPRRRDH